MNCEQVRQQLERGAAERADLGSSVLDHLRKCDPCRDHAEERRLIGLLRSLPVREPSAVFERRALQAALARFPEKRRSHHAAWTMALAASLTLAVAVTLRLTAPSPTQMPANDTRTVASPSAGESMPTFTVSARPLETRVVDVVLNSKHALQDATFVVTLDENLRLENRPLTRELRWQANVQAGGNKLSLPVQLFNGTYGEMVVTLEHGDMRRQVKVYVGEDDSSRSAADSASIET